MYTYAVVILIYLVSIYLVIGLVFSIFFIYGKGLGMVDKIASLSGIGFKIIIVPGCILLWPLLLYKWMNSNRVK